MDMDPDCSYDYMLLIELDEDGGRAIETFHRVDEHGRPWNIERVVEAEDAKQTSGNYRFKTNGYDSMYYCNRCGGHFSSWPEAQAHFGDELAGHGFYKWW